MRAGAKLINTCWYSLGSYTTFKCLDANDAKLFFGIL
jgi:hypothetical protein